MSSIPTLVLDSLRRFGILIRRVGRRFRRALPAVLLTAAMVQGSPLAAQAPPIPTLGSWRDVTVTHVARLGRGFPLIGKEAALLMRPMGGKVTRHPLLPRQVAALHEHPLTDWSCWIQHFSTVQFQDASRRGLRVLQLPIGETDAFLRFDVTVDQPLTGAWVNDRGNRLLTLGEDHQLQLWQLEVPPYDTEPREVYPVTPLFQIDLSLPDKRALAPRWSPRGNFFATGHSAGFNLHDSQDGTVIGRFGGDPAQDQGDAVLVDVAYSLREERIATASTTFDRRGVAATDRNLAIWPNWGMNEKWDLNQGKALSTSPRGLRDMVFDPTGAFLVTVDDAHGIQVWESDSGKLVRALPTEAAITVAVHPWRPLIAVSSQASGSGEATLQLWHLERGQPLRRFVCKDTPPAGLSFSEDGTVLLGADEIGGATRVRAWPVPDPDRIGP